MKKLISITLLSTLTACSVFGVQGEEKADYTIVKTVETNNIEIREYPAIVVASTTATGDYDEMQDIAFNRLFDYISGENQVQQDISMTAPVLMDQAKDSTKISMTAPVLMEETAQQQWRMAFVLPSNYSLAMAPKPTNPDVTLSQRDGGTFAAITFNGSLNAESIAKNKAILSTWLAENNYTATGDYQAAGYNPPWTLPAFRRNEVMVRVE